MKKECELIKDLLPNYVEKLTSEETNKYIEEHLNNCEECKKTFDNMSQDIKKEKKLSKKEIDYLKKYRNKIRNFKIFFIGILLIIIAVIVGKFGFKFYVLNKTISRNNNYDISGGEYNGGNFAVSIYEESVEKDTNPTKIYSRDRILKKVKGDTVLEYSEGEEYFYINQENKTYKISNDKELIENKNKISIKTEGLLNFDKKPSKLEILKLAFSKDIVIYKQDFRGKMYYIIRDMNGRCLWADMDTFFIERENVNGKVKEFRVSSGVVTYRETEKPDLTGYTLEK